LRIKDSAEAGSASAEEGFASAEEGFGSENDKVDEKDNKDNINPKPSSSSSSCTKPKHFDSSPTRMLEQRLFVFCY
ncbi:hypothetical protein NPIL_289161, partial [Nephila pilipes]